MDYRQKDWPEWLALAEFIVNNKVYSATKVSLFMANYGRELRIGANIRKEEKIEKATQFAERMKKSTRESLLWQPLVTKTNSITSNKSLKDGYLVGNLQENSTRSLFLIRALFIQMSHGLSY